MVTTRPCVPQDRDPNPDMRGWAKRDRLRRQKKYQLFDIEVVHRHDALAGERAAVHKENSLILDENTKSFQQNKKIC